MPAYSSNPPTNNQPHNCEGRLNASSSDPYDVNAPALLGLLPADIAQQYGSPMNGRFPRGHTKVLGAHIRVLGGWIRGQIGILGAHTIQVLGAHIVPVFLLAFPSFYATRASHLSEMAIATNLQPTSIQTPSTPTSRPSVEPVGEFEKAWVVYLEARITEWKVIFTLDFVFVGWVYPVST
jgi:hypothetical protein